ncbi:hypothetical protein ACFSC4_02915 [Deinococcus malanensis]|uniref:hypothetical protein n=1 Tax=Deinococcus malanensis TaxID=1706855 RepID=UPI0036423D9F
MAAADDAGLLGEAWARGLTAYGNPKAPARGSRVLLVAHRTPERENVSEAAADAETLARELGAVYEVELAPFQSPDELDWTALRARGLPVILATTARHRHAALRDARPDLHLALYNPYAVLDVDAPAIVTYGFRPEARAAVLAWLLGELTPAGRLPFQA